MLERLTIRNFQRHRRTTIEFDPLVTVIVGPTDAGKSTLIRVLRWIALNDAPRGEFILWGAKGVGVTLTVDGRTIRRSRNKDGNRYLLDESEFRAFGVNVPDPVAAVLKVSEENFQGQIDPPFWFSSGGGQVAREMNRIVDLSLIDESLAKVGAKMRTARTEREIAARNLKDAEEQAKSLSWVPEFRRDLAKLEELKALIDQKALEASTIDDKLSRLRQAEKDRKIAAIALPDVRKVLEIGATIEKREKELRDLTVLLHKIETTERGICELRESASRARSRLKKESRGKCPLCGTAIRSSPSPSPTSTRGTARR